MNETPDSRPRLLAVVELAGYPNLLPLYQSLGFDVELVGSQRKARNAIKARVPDVVVAEYNVQTDFRDRSSNLETIMGMLRKHPGTRVIVFYLPDHEARLRQFAAQFEVFAALPFPITVDAVRRVLQDALA